ncbi:MAG: galactose-1-epimerase [Alteromonadaceae bacterium]|nr:MAG: galactose-1-epimerase [Alteromonadaceae bacterium]
MPTLWGQDKQGNNVYRHTLSNANGMRVVICNYGAIIQQIVAPSKHMGAINTVLNFNRLSDYLADTQSIGAVCGRYCNRIVNAEFKLNNERYPLADNCDDDNIHSGPIGFNKRTWEISQVGPVSITLKLVSEDGDQGFPGELTAQVSYHLDEDNTLSFNWRAHSDKDTVVSLTNHTYFNLSGDANIVDHTLRIPCTHYTPQTDEGAPTGKIARVDGTVFDFTKAKPLREIYPSVPPKLTHPELVESLGLNHNWTHNDTEISPHPVLQAELFCPKSGLSLQALSTLPGLQCYTGNHLHKDTPFKQYAGICLESQYFPDSPNQPSFPSAVLRAGETLKHKTLYRFANEAAH